MYQLIQTIIAEYGTEDQDLLQEKMKQMRILDNIKLPELVAEVFVKSEKISVVDSTEEDDIFDEETDLLMRKSILRNRTWRRKMR